MGLLWEGFEFLEHLRGGLVAVAGFMPVPELCRGVDVAVVPIIFSFGEVGP